MCVAVPPVAVVAARRTSPAPLMQRRPSPNAIGLDGSIDGARITTAHVLIDGCTVTFGSEQATFREWSDAAALGTEPVR